MKVNLMVNQESKADDQLEIPAVAEVSFQQEGIFEHFPLNLKLTGTECWICCVGVFLSLLIIAGLS
jgi:hypothetical protein